MSNPSPTAKPKPAPSPSRLLRKAAADLRGVESSGPVRNAASRGDFSLADSWRQSGSDRIVRALADSLGSMPARSWAKAVDAMAQACSAEESPLDPHAGLSALLAGLAQSKACSVDQGAEILAALESRSDFWTLIERQQLAASDGPDRHAAPVLCGRPFRVAVESLFRFAPVLLSRDSDSTLLAGLARRLLTQPLCASRSAPKAAAESIASALRGFSPAPTLALDALFDAMPTVELFEELDAIAPATWIASGFVRQAARDPALRKAALRSAFFRFDLSAAAEAIGALPGVSASELFESLSEARIRGWVASRYAKLLPERSEAERQPLGAPGAQALLEDELLLSRLDHNSAAHIPLILADQKRLGLLCQRLFASAEALALSSAIPKSAPPNPEPRRSRL